MDTDPLIRPYAYALGRFYHPQARIVDELGLSGGKVYADVAAIHAGGLHLIEIKSGRDSLARLPRQVRHYSAAGSTCTLIAHPRHIERALKIIPPWWGLAETGELSVAVLRPPRPNPELHLLTVVDLLWRDEMLALCRVHGCARGMSRATRRTLNRQLRLRVPPRLLVAEVAHTLRGRPEGWR